MAFYVNLTNFFKFSCHLNEAMGAILIVQFLWPYCSCYMLNILFYAQFDQFDRVKKSINVSFIIYIIKIP